MLRAREQPEHQQALHLLLSHLQLTVAGAKFKHRDQGFYQAAQGSAGPLVSGQACLHSQPVLRSSDSTGSLTMPVEGLEGRSSGQMPMRAGSPALGGRASPKPPSWSSHMHDPFGELVTQDLKRIGSNSSSIT